jgi:DNA-binding FadR family transcriptional regulator
LPGEKLNIEKLAEEYCVSTTPVREVLNRLVAEELIDIIPKVGFFTKSISETEVRDLLELNNLLLNLSLECASKTHTITTMVEPPLFPSSPDIQKSPQEPSAAFHAATTGDLYTHIATQSGNNRIIHDINNISDQLYYLRLREYELIKNTKEELSQLCLLYHQLKFTNLQGALKRFHDKRSKQLPYLIKSLRLIPNH